LATEQDREQTHNRRANATIVQDVTSDRLDTPQVLPIAEESHERLSAEYQSSESSAATEPGERLDCVSRSDRLSEVLNRHACSADDSTSVTPDLTLLQEAAAALSSIAARAEALPNSVITQQAIHQIEEALAVLQRTFGSHTYP